MSAESERVERLVTMGERLIAAIEADLAALKAGKPQQMRTVDPEIQRLSALFSREAQGFSPDAADKVATPLRKRFFDTTSRFRDVLALHARLPARVRSASEGMIRAIAEEVDRQAAPSRPYSRMPVTRPAQAMIYNSVI